MTEQERAKPEAERVRDLEVREEDAQDIAGGKKKEGVRYGKKASGRRIAADPVNEKKGR